MTEKPTSSPDPSAGSVSEVKRTHERDQALARLGETENRERAVSVAIDPGVRAVVVAVGIVVLLASFALPHTGSANGWDVLAGDSDAIAEKIALPSRLFVWFALVFAVGFSGLALATQRWALAGVALYGSGVSAVLGMLAIWTRQTLPAQSTAAGPGAGLLLGWFAVLVIVFHWARTVWRRTAAQLEAAEQRRLATAEAELRTDRGPTHLA